MKTLLLLAVLFAIPAYAQESGTPAPPAEVSVTDEAEKLKIQVQLLAQQNAALQKQLAQAALQLAEANERAVQETGNQLVKQLAEKNGLRLEEYEFRIDDKGGMKFVKKSP